MIENQLKQTKKKNLTSSTKDFRPKKGNNEIRRYLIEF